MSVDQKIATFEEALKAMEEVEELPVPQAETIQAACCAVFKVTLNQIKSAQRIEPVAHARMISMCLCYRNIPSLSMVNVGVIHGGKDHTTVIHAARRVDDLCETDKTFRKRYDLVLKLIEAAQPKPDQSAPTQ